MAAYSVSQGVPYDQQPPPSYQSTYNQPAYNPAYTQSQGVPYPSANHPGYYHTPPRPPVTHVHTTYVTQPVGGGTDVSS